MFESQSPITLPIPTAPALAGTQPDGNFVRDACVLAVRAADRGDPANARNAIKTALIQLEQIGDRAVYVYWNAQIVETANYVEAKAGQSEQLQVAAQLSDDRYKLGQRLSPEEQAALVNDNSDTQNALDAEKSGGNVTIAYNQGKVGRETKAAIANASEGAAGLVGAALSPWKLALAVAAVLLAAVALGYGYVLTRTAGKVS